MNKKSESIIRQSQVHLKSTLKLLFILLIISAALFFFKAPAILILIAFVPCCFIGLLALLEILNIRNERRKLN